MEGERKSRRGKSSDREWAACMTNAPAPFHEDVIGYGEDKWAPEPTAPLAIAVG